MSVLVRADHHVVMKMDAALGYAGRAGRVQPECSVVFFGWLRFELGRCGLHQVAEQFPITSRVRIADGYDFAEMGESLARDRLEVGKQTFVDDGYASPTVVENVFVFVGFSLSVHRNSHSAYFDRPEKGVEEFGRVEKKEKHTVFRADAKTSEGIGGAISALKKLLIRDALVSTFDSDVVGTAVQDVAIHEIGGDVENLWQGDHVVTMFVA